MARFFGAVGYAEGNVEFRPGAFKDVIVEYEYYGDVIRNSRRLDANEKVNFDISVGNSISILADEYASTNFQAIRYVRWAGSLWVVTNVTVQRPRLILELGGVYNGPTP